MNMDQHHAQPSPHPEMHDDSMVPGAYPFYQDDASYAMAYQHQMAPYGQVVSSGHPPRSLSTSDLGHFQPQFRGMPMGLMPAHQLQQYPPQPMYAPAPEHVGMPLVGSPPASPHLYDPLSPPVSGSDTSGEGIYHSRGSSGAASPELSSRRNSISSRSANRYNPTPSPSSSSGGRRSRARSLSDDDGMGIAETIASTRKEVTRKQRIEAEQRRRDELRDGYAKLKDVLPVSNSKSSKVSLLERATKYVVDLEQVNAELQAALAARDDEISRLREINQKLSLSMGVAPAAITNLPSPGSAGMRGTATPPANPSPSLGAGPMTPPTDNSPPHLLMSVSGEDAPKENSSGSEDGF